MRLCMLHNFEKNIRPTIFLKNFFFLTMDTLTLFNSRKNVWFVANYVCAYSSFWARFACRRSVVMKIKVDSEWNLLLLCKHDVVNLFCLCGIGRIIGIGIVIIIYQIMVNKCYVVGCRSNYKGEKIVPVFSFPSDEDIKNRWIKFVNRKDCPPTSSAVICIKHLRQISEESWWRGKV